MSCIIFRSVAFPFTFTFIWLALLSFWAIQSSNFEFLLYCQYFLVFARTTSEVWSDFLFSLFWFKSKSPTPYFWIGDWSFWYSLIYFIQCTFNSVRPYFYWDCWDTIPSDSDGNAENAEKKLPSWNRSDSTTYSYRLNVAVPAIHRAASSEDGNWGQVRTWPNHGEWQRGATGRWPCCNLSIWWLVFWFWCGWVSLVFGGGAEHLGACAKYIIR